MIAIHFLACERSWTGLLPENRLPVRSVGLRSPAIAMSKEYLKFRVSWEYLGEYRESVPWECLKSLRGHTPIKLRYCQQIVCQTMPLRSSELFGFEELKFYLHFDFSNLQRLPGRLPVQRVSHSRSFSDPFVISLGIHLQTLRDRRPIRQCILLRNFIIKPA